jgi:hypothetical protein
MLDTTICNVFPYDETMLLWLTYKSETDQIWYVTSDVSRHTYQLWKGKKKTKWESDNPLSLYAHIK